MPVSRETFAFRSDSDLAQLAAARAGFGDRRSCRPAWRGATAWSTVLPDFHAYLGSGSSCTRTCAAIRRMRLMFDHLVDGLAAYVGSRRLTAPRCRGQVRWRAERQRPMCH